MPFTKLWTPEELEDIELPYNLFNVKHPGRTLDAHRVKRNVMRREREATTPRPPKPAPVFPRNEEAAGISDEELYDEEMRHAAVIAKAEAAKWQVDFYIELPADRPVGIVFASDWHVGNEGTNMERLRDDCRLIASHPRLYLALGGDVADNFIFEKMAAAARSQTIAVPRQWRLFRYLLDLVKDSLLYVSSGNHDQWTIKAAALDPVLLYMQGIKAHYTGEGAWVDIKVGEQVYTVYRKHKPTRFNSNFNRLHWHKQMLGRFLPREADVLVSEHLHEQAMEIVEYREKRRILIACGSYKENDLYARDGGYYTGGYGCPCVVFYPRTRRMLPFWTIDEALDHLEGRGAQPDEG